MKPQQLKKSKKASCRPTPSNWHAMNRKQRREMTRKIQSEDLSLEVVHPHAAGIDIGDESHYVAVPPSRDSQPVRCFGRPACFRSSCNRRGSGLVEIVSPETRAFFKPLEVRLVGIPGWR